MITEADCIGIASVIFGMWCMLISSIMASIWKRKMNYNRMWFDTMPNKNEWTLVFHFGILFFLLGWGIIWL